MPYYDHDTQLFYVICEGPAGKYFSFLQGDFPESLITTTAASVRSSTCMMYHEPFSTQKTLVQFGGIIPEVKCDHPYPSNPTTLFTLSKFPTLFRLDVLLR